MREGEVPLEQAMNTGRVQGRVVDSTGLPLPGVAGQGGPAERVQLEELGHRLLLHVAAGWRTPGGVDDIHFHPVEPFTWRIALVAAF